MLLLGNVCLLMEGLSKECQIACACAVFKFRDICECVQSGDITMSDLHEMSTHRHRVGKLCEATSITVSAVLDKRVEQYIFIEKRRRAYQDICNWIPDPFKIEGTFDCVYN